MPSAKSIERNALLNAYYPDFRREFLSLRRDGVKSTTAYELLAQFYGFKSWNGMYADLIGRKW